MTKGEVKTLDTERIVSPSERGRKIPATVTTEEIAANPAIRKQTNKTDLTNRFARLKKSSRKRSASIL